MAVWEDAEVASPYNQSTCRPLVGDSDLQGDRRNPKVNQQDVGGLRREEKWRPDRISAPEAREIWRRRQEELSGKSGRERRVITWPTQAREPAELPGWSSALQGPLQATCILVGIGGRPGRSGEEGGRGPPRQEEQERRGVRLPCPLEPRKPPGLPGEVPCPLRLGVGDTPQPLLFLEPKPHPPQPSGPFPALWVLSTGPAHCPNLATAQALPSTAKAFPTPPFFFLFPSLFLLLWY